jgi:hypothetical protein
MSPGPGEPRSLRTWRCGRDRFFLRFTMQSLVPPAEEGNSLDLGAFPGFFKGVMASMLTQSGMKRKSAEEEARMIRVAIDRMIERKELKSFLIEHGFITKTGKVPKRYGG